MTKLNEVLLQQQVDSLLEEYKMLYSKKYKMNPIIRNEVSARYGLKDVVRNMGGSQVLQLIKTYLGMRGRNQKDDWFEKQNHSIDCFLLNIPAINQLVSKPMPQGSGGEIRMSIRVSCDRCYMDYEDDFVLNQLVKGERLCFDCRLTPDQYRNSEQVLS